jgi:hypothetical protein
MPVSRQRYARPLKPRSTYSIANDSLEPYQKKCFDAAETGNAEFDDAIV